METTCLDSVQELFESTEMDKTTNKGEIEQIFSRMLQSVCGISAQASVSLRKPRRPKSGVTRSCSFPLDDGLRRMKSFLSWIRPSSAVGHLLSISALLPAIRRISRSRNFPDVKCYQRTTRICQAKTLPITAVRTSQPSKKSKNQRRHYGL